MIVVKLTGGLGNQMFQYAAAKALAARHHVGVKADLSFLTKKADGYTQRDYALDVFKTQVEIAGEADLRRFKSKAGNKITRFLQRSFPFLFRNLYAAEHGSAYHSAFKTYPENTYLDGYWQSEKYFADQRNEIISAFQPGLPMPAELQEIEDKIKTTNSVSLHVRRGDYVSLKSASDFHGTPGIAYYQKAVALLAQREKNIELFIFSDDISWCIENLKFDQPFTFISHQYAAVWDLYLMSRCRHNIIANSSFSWWAAWLNTNADKIVVAPQQWFADKKMNTNDLIPRSWIRL